MQNPIHLPRQTKLDKVDDDVISIPLAMLKLARRDFSVQPWEDVIMATWNLESWDIIPGVLYPCLSLLAFCHVRVTCGHVLVPIRYTVLLMLSRLQSQSCYSESIQYCVALL